MLGNLVSVLERAEDWEFQVTLGNLVSVLERAEAWELGLAVLEVTKLSTYSKLLF